MHIATPAPQSSPSAPPRDLIVGEPGSPVASAADPRFAQYKVIRRNGAVVGFEPAKITIAMTKAFLAVNGGQGAASARVRDEVTKLTDGVVAALMKRKPDGGAIHIEEIQDQVELALMRGGSDVQRGVTGVGVVTDRGQEVRVGVLATRCDVDLARRQIGRRVPQPRDLGVIVCRDRSEERKERSIC